MSIISGVSFGVMAVGLAGAVALYFLGKKIDREAIKNEQARVILTPNGLRF